MFVHEYHYLKSIYVIECEKFETFKYGSDNDYDDDVVSIMLNLNFLCNCFQIRYLILLFVFKLSLIVIFINGNIDWCLHFLGLLSYCELLVLILQFTDHLN